MCAHVVKVVQVVAGGGVGSPGKSLLRRPKGGLRGKGVLLPEKERMAFAGGSFPGSNRREKRARSSNFLRRALLGGNSCSLPRKEGMFFFLPGKDIHPRKPNVNAKNPQRLR